MHFYDQLERAVSSAVMYGICLMELCSSVTTLIHGFELCSLQHSDIDITLIKVHGTSAIPTQFRPPQTEM